MLTTITLVTLLVSSIGLNVWLGLRCMWLYDSWEAERKKVCKSCWLLFDYRRKADDLRKAWECIAELKERAK